MEYFCEVCYCYINHKSKYMHFKSKSEKEFDKCEHIVLSLKDFDINKVDEAFSLYIIEHNKKFDYYLVKCQFKLVFNFYEYAPYITSNLSDNKTMISWKFFLEKVIEDFKEEGYIFNHIAEVHIMTIAYKIDMTYDFYAKHNMHAVEWKVNKTLNEKPNLINKFNRNWQHPSNRKFEN